MSGLATVEALVSEFDQDLAARGRSPRTRQSYLESAKQFDHFLAEEGRSRQLREITASDVNAWVVHLRGRWSSATVGVRYRSLQAFFKWAVRSGELTGSPFAGTERPKMDVVPVNFPTADELRALLKVTEPRERTFEDWRDSAIIRLMIDTGCRLAEITTLKVQLEEADLERVDRFGAGQLEFDHNRLLVLGKGARFRRVAYGEKTRQALRRYLAARERHPMASGIYRDWLWFGSRGKPLSPSGLTQMLRRRCQEAGIRWLNPHTFRHYRADIAMGELHDSDVMTLFGWSSREMLRRYASARAEDRALEAARRAGAPGDRL